jgi:Ca-activated chloride channel family protein
MAEFHFLRPFWLLLLPLAVWAAWRFGLGRGGQDAWRAVVDRVLQPHVLVDASASAERRWPLAIALAAAAIAVLALAGPAWDRLPVPAYRSSEALIVALDLSRSMDAGDVVPSRLARARLKLLDLLERRAAGETGLVVFTANAFVVSPLTTDTRTVAAQVNSLSTDIMPSQGSLIDVGLDKAASRLVAGAAGRGEILVLTDSAASDLAIERAAELAASGISVHVLAVGTEEGAPIPLPEGGFLNDAHGQVVVPRLDAASLERLAQAGRGRFARMSADDSDLDRLFPATTTAGILAESSGDERGADIWRDRGIWLALALLPLVALAFRRGFVYVVLAGAILPIPPARAFDFGDLWQRPDQQAMRALERDEPAEAAALFDDPEWSAVASYRAGDFAASAALLNGIDTAEANYNRGNALARAGQFGEAVAAYDRALELEPGHEDARYNRDLVAPLAEQQQQQQQQQEQQQGQQGEQGQQQQDPSASPQAGDAGAGNDAGQDDSEADAEGRGSAAQNASEPDAAARPDDGELGPSPGEAGESPAAESATEPGESADDGEQQALAAASPEEVDDWASEQAADQWLRRIPRDPGGLLRRKFLYQYQQLGIDQDGNPTNGNREVEPW